MSSLAELASPPAADDGAAWHTQQPAKDLLAGLDPWDVTIARHDPLVGPSGLIYRGRTDKGIDTIEALGEMRSAAVSAKVRFDFETAMRRGASAIDEWMAAQDSLPTVPDALVERFGADCFLGVREVSQAAHNWDWRSACERGLKATDHPKTYLGWSICHPLGMPRFAHCPWIAQSADGKPLFSDSLENLAEMIREREGGK